MRAESKISSEIAKTKRQLEAQQATLKEAQGRRFMRCQNKKCGRKSQLSKWIFIVNHHYIQPYSCNGGAYWARSKNSEDLVCPHCGHEHRRCFIEETMSDEDFKVAEAVAAHVLARYDDGMIRGHPEMYVVR